MLSRLMYVQREGLRKMRMKGCAGIYELVSRRGEKNSEGG